MLFNSYPFIFVFLPVVVVGYYAIGPRAGQRWAVAWLVLASLFYYGWWNPRYVALIVLSVGANYGLGLGIARLGGHDPAWRRVVLTVAVVFNLGLLGYYKYAHFFVENVNRFGGTTLQFEAVVLPLAISFFTFQQLTYQVDVYNGQRPERSIWDYSLFVLFFPQLIAGPIVHHGEMLPQFKRPQALQVDLAWLASGIAVFALGLFKKVVIADTAALWGSPVFAAAERGEVLGFYEAWRGALAYTVQLYNDFSGYSDMAIGLGLMFGIRLPVNFNSPYKAASIIDFWRRWHMTLSRFLRDYLYIPLGGNRHGTARRYANLMITMLLGGLWHGAGWTFVLWGGLHGLYLLINHAWRALAPPLRLAHSPPSRIWKVLSVALTFLAVAVAWVLFRATTLEGALQILRGMAGLNGEGKFGRGALALLLIAALWLTFRAPNTLQWVLGHSGREVLTEPRDKAVPSARGWRPTLRWAIVTAVLFAIGVLFLKGISFQTSEFLYYQF